MRLCIVIVNYRTPGLVLDALDSLEGQVEAGLDEIVVVDNASGDDSAERLERAIAARGFARFCRVIRSPRNGGFAAGNNCAIRAAEANYYLLLNSDTIVRKGAIQLLLSQMQAHPGVGIAGPRLEWPDGTPQVSCFRDHTPISELLLAAKTGPISKFFRDFELAMPVSDEPCEADWISFACVLIRRDVIEKVGLLDEDYFMYFEDSDYCRAARAAGFRIRYFPSARVVHLRGGTSEVKRQVAKRKRPPRYLYESRTRYFRKGYGTSGVVLANLLWTVGRGVSIARELVGRKPPHTCELEWFDNWTDVLKPQA
jgi:N-acetylglucosaminyl-diphospho-decaprenol L-rhamnosyltransferase